MTAFIDYSSIPIHVRITNRHLIDPEYRATYQQHRAGGRKTMSDELEREIGLLAGKAREIAEHYGIGLKVVYRLRKKYRRKNARYNRGE